MGARPSPASQGHPPRLSAALQSRGHSNNVHLLRFKVADAGVWQRPIVIYTFREHRHRCAAGTEALLIIGPEILSNPPDSTTQIVFTASAWAINLGVAEYVIHRTPGRA